MAESPPTVKEFDFQNPLQGLPPEYFAGVPIEVLRAAGLACMNASKTIKSSGDLKKTFVLYQQESPKDEFNHVLLATFYAAAIAHSLDWVGPKSLERLLMGCLLHNVGMMKLPAALRQKHPSKLTPEEEQIYHQHPRVGVNFLLQFSSVDEALRQVVYQHHEHADGSGFPNRLTNLKIYPLARVASLATYFAYALVHEKIAPIVLLKRFMTSRAEMVKFDPLNIRALVKVFIKSEDPKKKGKG